MFKEDFSIISHMNDNKINIKPTNIIVIFEKCKFLEQIYESYKNDNNNILRQFILDHNRLDIIINNIKYKNIDDILVKLSSFDCCSEYIKNTKISSLILIIMLCCQSSFYYSFYYIHKQSDIKFNQLSDTSNTKKTINVIIDPENNQKKITFEANYKIIDCNNYEKKYSVKTHTELDLNASHGIINVDII